jgi:hypothetical protein
MKLDELESAIELYRSALDDKLSPDAKIALYEEIERLYDFAFLSENEVLGAR